MAASKFNLIGTLHQAQRTMVLKCGRCCGRCLCNIAAIVVCIVVLAAST